MVAALMCVSEPRPQMIQSRSERRLASRESRCQVTPLQVGVGGVCKGVAPPLWKKTVT